MIETEEAPNQVTYEGGKLAVSRDSVFGPTFQGEGPSVGRRCYFLRLAGCNQHCHWCDTPYTWAFSDRLAALHDSKKKYDPREEVTRETHESLLALLPLTGTSMLVVSGGEPMLQQPRLLPLLHSLKDRGWRLEIETAGTIGPAPALTRLLDQFNVSLKLESSGNPLALRYKPNAVNALQKTGKAVWKFVAVSRDDLQEVAHLVNEHQLDPVYIMPEGVTAEVLHQRMVELAPEVLARGWNLTTRLQIEIWGNKRRV